MRERWRGRASAGSMAKCPWATDLHDAFALARAVRPGQPRDMAPPVGAVGKGQSSFEKNPYEGLLGPNVEESHIASRTYRKADISKLVKTPVDVRLPFFFTLVTGPRRSLSLTLSDTGVYEPQIRARLGTTTHFCEVVVLKLRAVGMRVVVLRF